MLIWQIRPASSQTTDSPPICALLAAAPRIGGPRVTENFTLQGEPPDPSNVPSGCRFRTRCPLAIDACAAIDPPAEFEDGHGVACLRWREQAV